MSVKKRLGSPVWRERCRDGEVRRTLQRNMPALLELFKGTGSIGRAFETSHPPSAATFCAGTTAPPSRPGALTLCGRRPFAPNTPRRSPQGPAGSTTGASGHRDHRLPCAATLGHREPADGTAQDKALYAAPRIRRRHILLVRYTL